MSIRKRISQLLTPPMRRISEVEETAIDLNGKMGGAAQIRGILEHLLIDNDQDAECVNADLLELRDIGSKYGIYTIACEVQECVSIMSKEDKEGRFNKIGRGFELAADFHYQNVSKRINAAMESHDDIQPEELTGYVSRLVACYFLAKKHRKGIQVCVQICDDLILRGCELSHCAALFQSVAKDSVKAILELALHDKEHADRTYNRAKRKQSKSDTPMPEDISDPNLIDENQLSYLLEYQQKIVHVVSSLGKISGYSTAKEQLAYIDSIRMISNLTKYLPLAVFAFEQAGAIKESLKPGGGQEFFKTAAQLSERQATSEAELDFAILSRRHYEKAEGMWRLEGDISRAENAGTIASRLPRF